MTSENTTKPHITLNGTSYEMDSLSERSRMLLADMVRTVQEYNALTASYRQSLTLTTSYSDSLKAEVEKANLPIDDNEEIKKPTITIDDNRYDATDAPDTVKQFISDLGNSCKQKNNLEFRLRQLDAARSAYLSELSIDIEKSETPPMDPQPDEDKD